MREFSLRAVFYQNSSIENLEVWTHSQGSETGFFAKKPQLSCQAKHKKPDFSNLVRPKIIYNLQSKIGNCLFQPDLGAPQILWEKYSVGG